MADAEVSVVTQVLADTTDVKAKMAELPEVFKQGLGESEQAVSDAGTRMEARMEKAGEGAGNKFVDAFNLATAAIATTFLFKLREAVEQSAQMATQIKILSDVSGMSTTGVQKLQYAFSSVGISAEASRASLQQFQRVAANMVDVAQRTGFKGTTMLERMGIDPKQFENLNLEDQIKKVADRYKSLPAAQRAQTAEMFFGRGGLEMDPILAKGQTGVSQAVAGAGPTVPEAAIEKLHALEGGLATTGLEVKTLSAEFATTMAPAIMSVLGIIDRIVTGFSKMSYAIKQNFVVVALIAAFTQFDKALEFVSNFLRSIQFAEMAGALEVLGGPLIEIARLAGLLYIAFKSNFGNIRPVVEDVGRAVGDFAKNAQSFFTKISKVVTADLEPGISALSKAFAPLFAAIGAQLSAFLESSDTWNELGVAINIVATAVGLVAQGIAAIISPFSNFVGALTTDQREFLATGAAIAGIGIAFEVLAKSPFFMAQAIAIGEAAIAKVVTTVEALGAAWRFVASGEALAWVGMNLLTFGVPLAIAAVVAAVLLLWKNWDAVGRLVEKISAAWLEHLGALVSAIGDVETAIADFLNTLPGLQGMAKVIQGMADSARMLAGYLDAAAAAQKKLGDAVPPTYTEDTTEDRSHAAASRAAAGERPTKPGEPPTVIHPLNPATKTTHPSTKAATAAINAVKDSFRDLDSAVKTSTERIAELRADLALIGVINTPAKLSAAQAIMNKEVLESIRLTKNYHDLAAKETEGSAHLARLGAHEKNPAAQRLFVNAARSESDAAIKDRTKEKEQMVKTRDEQLKLKDATAAYYAVIAAGSSSSDNIIAALTRELAARRAAGDAAKVLLGLEKSLTTEIEKRASTASKHAGDEAKRQEIDVRGGITLRNTAAAGDTSGGKEGQQARKHILDALDATDELHIALIQETTAHRALADATGNLAAAQKADVRSETALADLTDKITVAQNNYTQAVITTTNDQLKLHNLEVQTSDSVLKTRQGFDSLYQQLAGPFMSAITDITKGVNPLTDVFLSLVKDSRSYSDIQKVLKQVAEALAKVFDALRPVVDLLLGVLTGIVNIFIGLFNIVASLLNVFGAHITKIQAVDDQLAIMGKSVPLLQITHDLPTFNEYNAGKYGPLVGKQAAQGLLNDNMTIGFNGTISKLGNILGEIIGIRALLSLIGVGSAVFGHGQGGGWTGLLQRILHPGHGGQGQPSSGSAYSSGEADTADRAGSYSTFAGPIGPGAPGGGEADTADRAASGDYSTASIDALSSATTTNMQTGLVPNTTASQNNTSALQSLSAALPSLLNAFMSKGGSGGGGIVAGLAGIAETYFSTKGSFAKTSDKLGTNLSYLGDAVTIAKDIFGGKPGQTAGQIRDQNAQIGSAVGNAIGTAFGGPLGGAIGGFLGKTVGGLFGPKHSGSQPDLTDPNFGNEEVGLTGKAFGTQGFGAGQMDPAIANMTGGVGLLQYIQNAIKSGTSGLSAAQIAEFGSTGGGKIAYGKKIEDERVVGGSFSGNYKDLWADAMAAAQKIGSSLTGAAQANQAMWAAASNVDLASVFGASGGTVSALGGGYSVKGNSNLGGAAPAGPTVNLTIGAVHGTDAATLQTAFQPIIKTIGDTIARQQKITAQTSGSLYGRDSF